MSMPSTEKKNQKSQTKKKGDTSLSPAAPASATRKTITRGGSTTTTTTSSSPPFGSSTTTTSTITASEKHRRHDSDDDRRGVEKTKKRVVTWSVGRGDPRSFSTQEELLDVTHPPPQPPLSTPPSSCSESASSASATSLNRGGPASRACATRGVPLRSSLLQRQEANRKRAREVAFGLVGRDVLEAYALRILEPPSREAILNEGGCKYPAHSDASTPSETRDAERAGELDLFTTIAVTWAKRAWAGTEQHLLRLSQTTSTTATATAPPPPLRATE